jgi:Fe-S oxidoreductase
MSRPDERPLRRLPALEPRKSTLERCVFCPKLCRTACPVSNAEPRETLTPWGKMSMAYFVANESVALAPSFADPAWACTGCFGCREHCDHKNDVTGTLYDARSALVASGVAPRSVMRVIEQFSAKAEVLRKSARELAVVPEVVGSLVPDGEEEAGGTALLLGCAYARGAPSESSDAVRATAKLVDGPVSIVKVCCGAPLLHAGDKKRFMQQGEMLAQAWYHDPCQLGRGLGVYDQPRALLCRALGRAPDEFERRREDGRCSGAGGLLPITMPDVARTIAEGRMAEHDAQGGGTVITACASSLKMFRKRGANAVDLVTVVARALGASG